MYKLVKDIILPAGAAWIGANTGIKQTQAQHKYQDARANLPILLEILDDLSVLEQAFIFNGRFCPLIEHRCPEILDNKDGDGQNTMSPAQRAHQFRMIGYRIIRNCRKIIFLTPKGSLNKTLDACREIQAFLCSEKTLHTTQFDSTIGSLLTDLAGKTQNNYSEFYNKLGEFNRTLACSIEDELPYLEEKKSWAWFNWRSLLIGLLLGFCIHIPGFINREQQKTFNRLLQNTMYHKELLERLKDPEEVGKYFEFVLKECKQYDDETAKALILEALKNVAEAQPDKLHLDLDKESFTLSALLGMLNFVSKKM